MLPLCVYTLMCLTLMTANESGTDGFQQLCHFMVQHSSASGCELSKDKTILVDILFTVNPYPVMECHDARDKSLLSWETDSVRIS